MSFYANPLEPGGAFAASKSAGVRNSFESLSPIFVASSKIGRLNPILVCRKSMPTSETQPAGLCNIAMLRKLRSKVSASVD